MGAALWNGKIRITRKINKVSGENVHADVRALNPAMKRHPGYRMLATKHEPGLVGGHLSPFNHYAT
jgi:hypothetical protein